MADFDVSMNLGGLSNIISQVDASLAALTPPPITAAEVPTTQLVAVATAIGNIGSELAKIAAIPVPKVEVPIPGIPPEVGAPTVEEVAVATFPAKLKPTARVPELFPVQAEITRAITAAWDRLEEISKKPPGQILSAMKSFAAQWDILSEDYHSILAALAEKVAKPGKVPGRFRPKILETIESWEKDIDAISSAVAERVKKLSPVADKLFKTVVKEFSRLKKIPEDTFNVISRFVLGLEPEELRAKFMAMGVKGAKILEKVVPVAETRPASEVEDTDKKARGLADYRERVRDAAERTRAFSEQVRALGGSFSKLAGSVGNAFQTVRNSIMAPLEQFHRFQMEIRRTLFSVLLFWFSAQQFIEPAARLIRTVQASTIAAGSAFEDWSMTLSKVSVLSSKYAVPIENVAKAHLEIAKAGYTAEEAQTILNASLAYGTVLNEDMVTVIGEVISVLRAFNLPASEAVNVVNLLYNATAGSLLSVESLKVALSYGAIAASEFNISLKEMLALFMFWSDRGVQASRIGTGFRAILDGIATAAGQATDEQMTMKRAIEILPVDWKALNEALEEGNRGYSAMRIFLEGVNRAMQDGLSIEERLAVKQIVKVRNLTQALSAARELNTVYGEYFARLEKTAELEEMATKVTESWAGLFTIVSNLWVTFRAGFVTGLGEVGNVSVRQLEDLSKRVMEIGTKIGQLVYEKLLKPILGEEGFKNIEDVINRIASFVTSFLGAFVPRLAAAFRTLVGGIEELSPEKLGELLGNILGAIIEALAGISRMWIEIIAKIAEGAGGAENFSNLARDIYETVGKLKSIIDAIGSPLKGILGTIKEILTTLLLIKSMPAATNIAGMLGGAGAQAAATGVGAKGLLGATGLAGKAAGGIVAGIGAAAPFLPLAVAALPLASLLWGGEIGPVAKAIAKGIERENDWQRHKEYNRQVEAGRISYMKQWTGGTMYFESYEEFQRFEKAWERHLETTRAMKDSLRRMSDAVRVLEGG